MSKFLVHSVEVVTQVSSLPVKLIDCEEGFTLKKFVVKSTDESQQQLAEGKHAKVHKHANGKKYNETA